MARQIFILLFPLLMSIAAASEQEALPQDVASFIDKRDLCDHFRGEEPYDEERRAFLLKNITELCTGSDEVLANLKDKYQHDSFVLNKLSIYEEDIEVDK